MRLSVLPAVLAALLVLTACQAPSPPPPPAVVGPVLPVPPAAIAIPARPREPARWHFATGPDTCTAEAIGRTARLRVELRRAHGVSFVLIAPSERKAKQDAMDQTGPGAPSNVSAGALSFEGRDGSWTASARLGPGARAMASLPLNATAVGRVALLLGGGTLDPIGAPAGMPGVALPVAGAAGRTWYGCARGLLF